MQDFVAMASSHLYLSGRFWVADTWPAIFSGLTSLEGLGSANTSANTGGVSPEATSETPGIETCVSLGGDSFIHTCTAETLDHGIVTPEPLGTLVRWEVSR